MLDVAHRLGTRHTAEPNGSSRAADSSDYGDSGPCFSRINFSERDAGWTIVDRTIAFRGISHK
jgi:hypothetical protein